MTDHPAAIAPAVVIEQTRSNAHKALDVLGLHKFHNSRALAMHMQVDQIFDKELLEAHITQSGGPGDDE